MLFHLPEFSAHLWISGYTSTPKDFDEVIRAIVEKYPNADVQFADLDNVPGSRYLFLATMNALKSFTTKPIAKSLGMEILLYIAANRQITEAIRLVGIASNTQKTVAVLVGKTEGDVSGAADLMSQIIKQESNDELVDSWSTERIRNVRAVFQIGSKELKSTLRENETVAQAVERLAIERSALLTIKK